MGYPKEVYDRAWQQLEAQRRGAEETTDARQEEIGGRIPEVLRINREMALTASSVAKVIASDPGNAPALVEQLKQKSMALQARRAELLTRHGYPADYLARQYGCRHCRDTGYNGPSMCGCFREMLRAAANEGLGTVSQAERCDFDGFSLAYYPTDAVDASGVAPRQRMAQIYEYCKQYAATFNPQAESLLLLGQTGLGKTHLSLAIASEVIQRGYGVVYTPMQRLMDQLEADKFSYADQNKERYARNIQQITTTDLLVLDDLGTEFTTQFTTAVVFNIINTRLVENRPTIISTNLELAKMEEKYSPRVVSRLVCGYKVLKFYGKDIRFIKKQTV